MKVKLFLFGLLLVALSMNSNAQVTFQVGAGAGYSVGAGDLPNEWVDGGYGMDGGFNIHAKARVGLLTFIGVGEVGYTMMTHDGTTSEDDLNILSLKVGPEFHISLPLIPIDPYLGANFQVNTFSGESRTKGTPSATYEIESAARYGIGINGGVIFSLGGLKLDLNLGYNMLNAFGKDFENNTGSDTFLLNDGEGDGFDARSINTLEFKVTAMIGI
ncbi:MAG: hypothetical protein KKA84_02375 [Bacteroidetes bacterium]|nr:hypothetical protein [Bacteroidota bacterium]